MACGAIRMHAGETLECVLEPGHTTSHQTLRGHFWSTSALIEDHPAVDYLTVGRLVEMIVRGGGSWDMPVRVAGEGDWPFAVAGAAIVDAVDPWPQCLLIVLGDQLEPEDHVAATVADIVGAP